MSPVAGVILAPVAGAVGILLLRRAAGALALTAAAVGLGSSVWLIASLGAQHEIVLPGLPGLPLRLTAQPLSALLSLLVGGIGALVLVYAVGYMRTEPGRARFFAQMSLFVAAMQVLVLAGDWLLLLAAWELIGLCSYLLIGFWFERREAAAAASRAFLYTRTADLGLYAAVLVLIAGTGSSEIEATLGADGGTALIAGLLLLVAAMGKSAQTPLQGWLLGAMAGPTPVSALLHSATLVAAGAILMIRVAPLLPPGVLIAVGLAGGITSVVAGLIALADRDLKRTLAASTAAQYGLMLVAVGAGAPIAALLLLVAHAAIKSALFLAAGLFQRARGGTDFTRLQGVGRALPRTYFGFAVAALALAGAPPLSGFFAKDAIIAGAMNSGPAALFVPLAVAGTFLTGAYMARALRLLWRGPGEGSVPTGAEWMGAGLAGLAAAAALLGAAFDDIERLMSASVPSATGAMLLGLGAAAAGLLSGWLVPAGRLLGPLHVAAQGGFVIAGGFDRWVAAPFLVLARSIERLEQAQYAAVTTLGLAGWRIARAVRRSDEHGINGAIFALVAAVRAFGASARALQSGLVHRELAVTSIVVGVIVVLFALSTANM